MFPTEYPEFVTVTCLDWKSLLQSDSRKQIVVNSLRFLAINGRAMIYAFVIMPNHLHAIWQFYGGHQGGNVLRDFLKYTSQQLLRDLAEEDQGLFHMLEVNKRDRKFQVWKRNSLRIPLWSNKVFDQKLNYIHQNPVRAGLCNQPEDYKYSSASYYMFNQTEWDFLTHADG